MNVEREKFLARITTGLSRALLPGAGADHPEPFRGYTFQAGAPVEKLIEDFGRELQALSGHFHRPATHDEVVALVLEILRDHQANRMIAWAEADLGLPGLLAALTQAGIQIEDSRLATHKAGRQARLAELDHIPVGLTGAQAGLADTGSLVLLNGPGRSRLASLLPPVHLALLPAQNLYPSLPAFLSAYPAAVTAGSNMVLITGPSRTGDIEMILSLGVHGPKELHVIIV